MEENQLQNRFEEVLLNLINQAEDAAAFVTGEIPDVLEQLLVWSFAESITYLVLSLFMFCSMPFIYGLFDRIAKKTNDGGFVCCGVMCDVWLCIPACFLFNLTWLKIWLAPKLFLIEYAAELVK